MVQRPDLPVRARLTAGSALMLWVMRPSWLWRREQAALLALVLIAAGAWLGAGLVAAAVAPACLVVVVVAVPWSRRRAARTWRRARLRRHWDRACRFAGLTTVNDRIPRIRRQADVAAGERLLVRVPRGATAEELEAERERVAAVLRVREVRVNRDVDRADWAHVDIVRRNPFVNPSDPATPLRIDWPLADAAQLNLWDPVPVAVDDMGDLVSIKLLGKNLLLGGEPEAGKSAALSLLLAAAALDPGVKLWGLDAKRLELALWKPVMDQVVYNDIDDAISMLGELIKEMDQRYEFLEGAGRRVWLPSDGPVYVIPIDELRFYTTCENRKARTAFNARSTDLAARGRAAALILLAATQKPSTDVVPSSLRDLLALRWALRCTTRDASDTILGSGWASEGFDASDIDVASRGEGLLLAEGGFPRRCKSFYLTDQDITSIAARGAALRRLAAADRPG